MELSQRPGLGNLRAGRKQPTGDEAEVQSSKLTLEVRLRDLVGSTACQMRRLDRDPIFTSPRRFAEEVTEGNNQPTPGRAQSATSTSTTLLSDADALGAFPNCRYDLRFKSFGDVAGGAYGIDDLAAVVESFCFVHHR